jgi:hypothetical protein
MRLPRSFAAGVLCLCLAVPGRAASPPSPVRLVHENADLLLEVPNPRHLVETLLHLDVLQQLQVFPNFREALDSTPLRRGTQLVAYLEKELGAPWPELLDRLAGGGTALATKFGTKPAPALLVIQGKDEKLMEKFFQVGLDLLDQEIARQEGKLAVVRDSYRGLPTAHVGKEFHVGRAGAALLVSTNDKALQAGLDRHLGRETKSLADSALVQEARKLLPKEPLARIWVSLDAAHKSEAGKALYKAPRDDPQLTVLFGKYLDLVGRSPFVCAGVYRQADGFLTTIRLPRGREGMGNDRLLHLPAAGEPGSRPLLEPKGVLYSDSNYLNISGIWTDRAGLFAEKQVKSLEEFDKRSARFLLLKRMSDLLTQVGPYLRFVAVNQTSVPYKTQPEQMIPAFALVSELRDPEPFGKSMEAILRAAALLTNFNPNVKLKTVEEKYKGCTIVGYRFDEKKPLTVDVTNFRFNFNPCFTRVGKQFVYCSTLELCRELVDLLQKEAKEKPASDEAVSRARLYGAGGAEVLQGFEDQLVTQTILDQAVKPAEAREQTRALIDFVRRLGTLDLTSHVGGNDFRYDIRLTLGKSSSR